MNALAVPCAKPGCPLEGQVHPMCAGHRKRTDPPEPCGAQPVTGADKCRFHGFAKGAPGRAGADRRATEAQILAGPVAKLLDRYRPTGEKLPDRMLGLCDQLGAMVGVLRVLVADLDVGTLYGPDHLGDNRAHVLVSMYRDFLAEYRVALRDATAMRLDETRTRLMEREGELVAGILRGVLEDLLATLGRLVESGQLDRRVHDELVNVELRAIVERHLTAASAALGRGEAA